MRYKKYTNHKHPRSSLLFFVSSTTQQNGKVGWMIRRLYGIIRALLIHAKLTPRFWVEALHASLLVYHQGLIWSTCYSMSMTSF